MDLKRKKLEYMGGFEVIECKREKNIYYIFKIK